MVATAVEGECEIGDQVDQSNQDRAERPDLPEVDDRIGPATEGERYGLGHVQD